MNGWTKLAYILIIAAIIMPTVQQWNTPLQIKKKQSHLPPELPTHPIKNDKQLAIILASNLWDKERSGVTDNTETPSKDEKSKKQEKWILKGIGIQQNQAAAVITSNKQINSYYQNDTLPDGAKLIAININNIVIEHAGETHNVYLFK